MSPGPLESAEMLCELLEQLDAGRTLKPEEAREALLQAEALVEYTAAQTRGLRRRKLDERKLAASRRRVETALGEYRAVNPRASQRSATAWIANRTGLPASRVRAHLEELNETVRQALVAQAPHRGPC
jgi:hypothetical protein